MFRKQWHLWSFLLRRFARAQGFLDPITVLSNLQRFGKPSEVWVPTELLRSGAILQARGLMNSQAIQHNLDWIWPYWVKRQFDPTDNSFIPRAFSIAHINLTHRNWTALGLPDFPEFPLVDPRGLVTPHYDGWSVDSWILKENQVHLIPSCLLEAKQELLFDNRLAVESFFESEGASLLSRAEVISENGSPVCRMTYNVLSDSKAWFAVAVRPYNPEGVSFVNDIRLLSGKNGWKIDSKHELILDQAPSRYAFSNYAAGDVFAGILKNSANAAQVQCEVGMAGAVALYEIEPNVKREFTVRAPLVSGEKNHALALGDWGSSLQGHCQLRIPDKHFQFLYDAALRTLVLHSPGDIFPGPYTYKRFWFRDAAFILHAMLCVGLTSRVKKGLEGFFHRQTVLGHFLSQDGEWDSNGQALWMLGQFCRFTDQKPEANWYAAIRLGAQWIQRKRVARQKDPLHSGLLPAGFSAEHLGPNDFYYWDDFWGIGGLQAAADMMESMGDKDSAGKFRAEAEEFMRCVENSLEAVKSRLEHEAMPASPTRRMDAGAVGSLAVGYPLQLWKASDARLLGTADFLLAKCFLKGGFYQEISHSGVNAYLTLHVAQVFLRAGDSRFMDLAKAIAFMASPTGQWPEAIHPITGGGCMGDGQHVWAAAEWVLLIRNMFVREEDNHTALILCSGIPDAWIKKGEKIFFGSAPTAFGKISVTLTRDENIRISWEAHWHKEQPPIEIHLPGHPKIKVPAGQNFIEIKAKENR